MRPLAKSAHTPVDQDVCAQVFPGTADTWALSTSSMATGANNQGLVAFTLAFQTPRLIARRAEKPVASSIKLVDRELIAYDGLEFRSICLWFESIQHLGH